MIMMIMMMFAVLSIYEYWRVVVKPVGHDDDDDDNDDGEDDGDDNSDVVYEITKIKTTLIEYKREYIYLSGMSTILID